MLKFFNWTQVKDLSLSCTKEKGNNQINVLATLISENQTGTWGMLDDLLVILSERDYRLVVSAQHMKVEQVVKIRRFDNLHFWDGWH